MKFGEFLNKLYDHSHQPGRELYVLQIFSAICGERDPFGSNSIYSVSKKSAKFSSALPGGLTGDDPTYRKRLYNSERLQYNGLSKPIKNHIAGRENKDTFINYLKKTVSSEEVPKLCVDFEISDTVDKSVVFESIYDQFLKFVYSPSVDIKCIVLDRAKELSMTEPSPTQLKSGSTKKDVSLERNKSNDASQSETPSEQIREIFEKAIDGCRIACYVNSDCFQSINNDDNFEIVGNAFDMYIKLTPTLEDFIKYIKSNILDKFVSAQKESIYVNIRKFVEILTDYDFKFKNLTRPNSPELNYCIRLLQADLSENDFITEVDLTKKKIIDEKNKMYANGEYEKCLEQFAPGSSEIPDERAWRVFRIDDEINDFDSIKSIYFMRKQIDSLYGKICNGKTLFVY